MFMWCIIWFFGCLVVCNVFFFKQKTAYEMRISDWSSDVCSSDLLGLRQAERRLHLGGQRNALLAARKDATARRDQRLVIIVPARPRQIEQPLDRKSVV